MKLYRGTVVNLNTFLKLHVELSAYTIVAFTSTEETTPVDI
jgi:hypothetical protein